MGDGMVTKGRVRGVSEVQGGALTLVEGLGYRGGVKEVRGGLSPQLQLAWAHL